MDPGFIKKARALLVLSLSEEELKILNTYNLESVDILEVRFDLCSTDFIKKELTSILKNIKKPLIFTYRVPADSSLEGNRDLKLEDVLSLLKDNDSERNYLDLELNLKESFFDDFKGEKYSFIYSYHNFQRAITLSEMQILLSERESIRGRSIVYKFAVKARNISEFYEFFSGVKQLSLEKKIAAISMGELGMMARIFPEKFSSVFTYACLGEPKAPGQVSIELYQKIRKF